MKKKLLLAGFLIFFTGFELGFCAGSEAEGERQPRARGAGRIAGRANYGQGVFHGPLNPSWYPHNDSEIDPTFFGAFFQFLYSKVTGVNVNIRNVERKDMWKVAAAPIVVLCVVMPVIKIFEEAITGACSSTILASSKRLIGKWFNGIDYEITNITNNCYNIFTSLNMLARTGQVYANREVANAMRARRPAPDMLENSEEADAEAAQSNKAEKSESLCAMCQKPGGSLEFYFDCQHGMHPQCAKLWLKKPSEQSLHCANKDCSAIRKFDIMQPDIRVTGMLEKFNATGPAASEIIKIRAAQKQIANLIGKLDKRSNDTNAMYKQKLLAAIYQDLENLYKVLAKQKTFKDFCNQEALEQVIIFAGFGQNSCTTLNNFIQGTSNDANIQRQANNNALMGGGLGGNQGFGGFGGI